MTLLAVATGYGREGSRAENPRLTLGCPESTLNNSGSHGVSAAGTIKVAAKIDPTVIPGATDLKVVGFDYGMASKINVTSVTVWASYEIDGQPFVEQQITSGFKKGWNNVTLSAPVAVDTKPFYVGYTLECGGASYPVATVAGDTGSEWYISHGGEWETVSEGDKGVLALSVTVEGENLPLYDLTLLSADVPARIHSTLPTKIPMEVRNAGALPVSAFTVRCTEGEDTYQDFYIEQTLNPNERKKIEIEMLPMSPESEALLPFTVALINLKEGEDCNPEDNSITTNVKVSPFRFQKNVLIEEFTTERCPNCPRAAGLLHDLTANEYYDERVAIVCHHSGFYIDSFTQECDNDLLALYGSGTIFAPAMSVDRDKGDDPAVAQDVPMELSGLTTILDGYLAKEAEVDLNLYATLYPDENRISVKVQAGCAADVPTHPCAVTVYVVENDVPAISQSGGGEGYKHQHVIRAYNNESSWGDLIEWDDLGKFENFYIFDLPEGVNTSNLEVIGFISKDSPADRLGGYVLNTSRQRTIDVDASGIEGIEVADVVSTTYYNLAGFSVSADTKGLLIAVDTYSNGRTKARKIIR